MRKETLATHKNLIKVETQQIRSLKERNRILSRNHALSWEHSYELTKLQKRNSQRHYWYFRLKNLYTTKHNENIMKSVNPNYPDKTAVYYNELGAEQMFITALKRLES
jgi:Asp-tRNA(Asn)/Glu-tRNA(Gln) amidotransferase B subunit